ncbi:hypothetical protein HUW51_24130 [Adhaeribacter swui]|uniref:Potassium transporter KefB n=1 Tax=Adhaeribacter swui TaxID=2086471 RepID=A0A7G7GER1_9BACT|nr:hypothetical protein [Adhaeribacter swui]QNF35645.1 hypothetical protein HUW51_24130 [Adhaeribacter swui]
MMTPREIQTQTVGKRAGQGALIALGLVTIFIVQLQAMDVDYGAWVLLPLLTVSVGGAIGGIIYYLVEPARQGSNGRKWLVNISCALVYCLILWLSLIAALSVTGHWD